MTVLLTIGLLVVLIGLVVATARLFRDYPASELLDWKPTRSPEVEVQNEIDDLQQMIDAQNELRRKRGAPEITQADVERQAREDQAVRARGGGPFAQGGGVEDELEASPPLAMPKRARGAKGAKGAKGRGSAKGATGRGRAKGAKKGS